MLPNWSKLLGVRLKTSCPNYTCTLKDFKVFLRRYTYRKSRFPKSHAGRSCSHGNCWNPSEPTEEKRVEPAEYLSERTGSKVSSKKGKILFRGWHERPRKADFCLGRTNGKSPGLKRPNRNLDKLPNAWIFSELRVRKACSHKGWRILIKKKKTGLLERRPN